MSSIRVGTQGPQEGFTALVNVDAANVPAASVLVVAAVALLGVDVGDLIQVSAPSLEAGLSMGDAFATAPGVLSMRIINPTAGAVNPAAQNFLFRVTKGANTKLNS